MRENDLQALGRELHGDVIDARDATYDAARQVWNGLIDRHPALIAQCVDAADVAASLRFAQDHDLVVAVRGGGHSIAGYGTCDSGIVIDLGRMKAIDVDMSERIARAQGGVTWGELDRETQRFGLATPGGVISTTGIAGLTLGGGFGWLSRRFGATVDNLLAAQVVTADGQIIRASAEENAELFWGLRGGGGNFGVVTSFEYRLHPVGPMIFGGFVGYPIERAPAFLRFYREWMPTVPDELSADVVLLSPLPGEGIDPSLVGKPMITLGLCYSGPVENGEEQIASLRAFGDPELELLGPLPFTEMQSAYDSYVPHGICAYWQTAHCKGLSDGLIISVLDQFSRRTSARSMVVIEYLAGAFGRRDEATTAFTNPGDPYRVLVEAISVAPEEGERNVAWANAASDSLAPFSSGSVYLNYLGSEGEERVKIAYGSAKYAQLMRLKQAYDPTNVFRLNQNIAPAIEPAPVAGGTS
jgi:FAD/FMN-containing dehydrogenase